MSLGDFGDDDLDPLRPMEMPLKPPQLEAEEQSPLGELMDATPGWDPNFAVEAVLLLKRHSVLRSLFGYSLQVAMEANKTLQSADDPIELHRAQGKIKGLHQFYLTIMNDLQEAEQHKDTANELPQ